MDWAFVSLSIVAILLVVGLRIFSTIEGFKKRAVIVQKERQLRSAQSIEEKAILLRRLFQSRLGLDSRNIPLDAKWKGDLRIPAGELYDFFQDIDQELMLNDLPAVERQATYGELLEFIGIPATWMGNQLHEL